LLPLEKGLSETSYIPFNLPTIGEEEIAEVVATLKSGWLTTGPRTAQFEREFCSYVQSPHALAVNSCTAGLHLALAALGVGKGDEVITTPLTFCATVNTILHVGATPVLADIGEDGNVDPEIIASRITERTKAIVPVHIGGLPCQMDAIWDLARRHNLRVVEDAAHAIGSQYKGLPIGGGTEGRCSDVVAFSFYATKNLTTGEGGMVTTHREALLERMRILCLHGISKDAWNRYSEKGNWYYEVVECGFKYNLSDIQSAIGIHQLRRQERFVETRKLYAHTYNEAFEGIDEVELPPDDSSRRNSWHLYALRLNLERLNIDRSQFIQALRERGIGASVHFIPIPLHPFFSGFAELAHNRCPKAMELYPRLVSLPLYPEMTMDQVGYVAGAVKEICQNTKKRKLVPVLNAV
jgi:dTDP-4-amino-4,6-dideoxygalactose transaminase